MDGRNSGEKEPVAVGSNILITLPPIVVALQIQLQTFFTSMIVGERVILYQFSVSWPDFLVASLSIEVRHPITSQLAL